MAKAVEKLSTPLQSILRTALRREPRERFQTAEELEDALQACLAVVGPYGAHEAIAEVEQAMMEAGAAMVAQELSDRPRAGARKVDPDAISTR